MHCKFLDTFFAYVFRISFKVILLTNKISGDKPLYHALQLMSDEGISSLAVVDNHANVVGNISIVDVKV